MLSSPMADASVRGAAIFTESESNCDYEAVSNVNSVTPVSELQIRHDMVATTHCVTIYDVGGEYAILSKSHLFVRNKIRQ